MKISVITPTHLRHGFLPGLVRIFKTQTHADKELLILDDSPAPAGEIEALARTDTAIRYFNAPARMSIGDKRNWLIAQAQGDFIVHFDDDEYYAPEYLAVAHTRLEECDFVKLSAWYLYSLKDRFFGYWDTRESSPGAHFDVSPGGKPGLAPDAIANYQHDMLWGFGFSYAYRKSALGELRFSQIDFGEDYDFARKLQGAGLRMLALPDTSGLVVHMIHEHNMSRVFPQFRLPEFQLRTLFGQGLFDGFPALGRAGVAADVPSQIALGTIDP